MLPAPLGDEDAARIRAEGDGRHLQLLEHVLAQFTVRLPEPKPVVAAGGNGLAIAAPGHDGRTIPCGDRPLLSGAVTFSVARALTLQTFPWASTSRLPSGEKAMAS